MNPGALAGLAIMIVSQGGTLAKVEPFYSWNTPICWSGFILFADSVVYRARGSSWLRSAPREFALLALASIPLWLVFEFYNLFLDNWHYVGLPENRWVRTFGYAWAFATIWPAIFEGAELVGVWRRSSRDTVRLGRSHSYFASGQSGRVRTLSIIVGIAMLLSPFFAGPEIARYLAAPVWLGFIFLLEPINTALGGESLFPNGQLHRFYNLVLSGLLCGILWELWNYWSRSKWHYTVPIMENMKIFEMPLPGYAGFPAFALECFTMYVFLRALVARGRTLRPIAL
jgi:hypothetical protein